MSNSLAAVLRLADAADYIGVSLRHFHTLYEQDPTFPKKIIFSSRCVGFRRVSLDRWLDLKEGVAANDD